MYRFLQAALLMVAMGILTGCGKGEVKAPDAPLSQDTQATQKGAQESFDKMPEAQKEMMKQMGMDPEEMKKRMEQKKSQ
jgi:hypothetical protein